MSHSPFRTAAGRSVPAVTASEMAAVDRVAVEEVGLQLLQMMENAGRILASHVRDVRADDHAVTVVAGTGGNGGGGLSCARHLVNRDIPVRLVLDRPPADLSGAAATQYRVLDAMSVPVTSGPGHLDDAEDHRVLVDALIGYGLEGALRSPADALVAALERRDDPIVSLDVPSGLDATTGESLGEAVTPDRTVTLALPKTGLAGVPGSLYLADIAIPPVVYDRLDIDYVRPFGDDDWVRIEA